jgi:hypothetical protein
MLCRIGINPGDILIEGQDILGDGVNAVNRRDCSGGGRFRRPTGFL